MTEDNSEKTNPYESTAQPDFLQDAMEYRDNFEDDEEFQEALAIWPTCPDCGKRRITYCPICHTAGNLFPLADADYWEPIDPEPVQTACCSSQTAVNSERVQESQKHDCCGTCHCHDGEMSNEIRTEQRRAEIVTEAIPDAIRAIQSRTDKKSEAVTTNQDGQSDLNGDNPSANGNSSASNNNTSENDNNNSIPLKYSFSTQWGDDPLGIKSFSMTSDELSNNFTVDSDFNEVNYEDADVIKKQTEVKLVVCHVCSEPFVPHFPAKCEWCGHVFEKEANPKTENSEATASGEADEENPEIAEYIRASQMDNKREEIDPKLFLVIGAMLALGLGAIVYCYTLFL